MVAEIDLESIPVTLSLIVFEGRYGSLQKFHSFTDFEEISNLVKPGFHIVLTGRWVSLTDFHSHWSIWVIGNHCQSMAVFQSRWRSCRVVDSLSWSLLTIFQSLHIKLRQTYSLPGVGGRQRYFVLFPYNTNERTGSLAVCR